MQRLMVFNEQLSSVKFFLLHFNYFTLDNKLQFEYCVIIIIIIIVVQKRLSEPDWERVMENSPKT